MTEPGKSDAAMERRRSLVTRAGASPWVAGEPHLAEAVAELVAHVGPAQEDLTNQAVALAQPGPVDPVRLARHAAAAGLSRAIRVTTGLPAALTSGKPFTDPQGWLQSSAIEAFVDQLALGGAASAELARLIEGGGELFPSSLRRELDKRDIRPLPLAPTVIEDLLRRAFGSPRPGGPVRLVDELAITGTPVSQLHEAETDEDPRVAVRVRRPRIARDLLSDSKLAAGAASALTRVAPDAGGMGPIGFVQLVLRQCLESTDLRFEALNLVELGLIVEDLAVDGLVVARPLPGYVDERAVVIEHLDGTPLTRYHGGVPDPASALRAIAAITLESALVHGIFWADPAPEHLLVLPDDRLALVGVGTLGRFTPELRLAGVRVIKAVLTGEHEGMIEGMRIAGAMSDDVDTAALLADLKASDLLDPSKILFGGEGALLDALNAAVGIMLAHKLQPPVEVTLMLRTVFAVGQLVHRMDPDGNAGLTAALMPLMPRLPEIIAAAEAAVLDR
jgi:hypothetical protein